MKPSVFLKHGVSLLDLIYLLWLEVLPVSSPSSHACLLLPGSCQAFTTGSWMLSLPRGEAPRGLKDHTQA